MIAVAAMSMVVDHSVERSIFCNTGRYIDGDCRLVGVGLGLVVVVIAAAVILVALL